MTPALSTDGTPLRRLSEQAKRLPHRPNASTLWRWSKRGIKGVRLETVNIGGVAYCSDGALDQFLKATNEPSSSSSTPRRRSKRECRESVKRAEKILEKAGI